MAHLTLPKTPVFVPHFLQDRWFLPTVIPKHSEESIINEASANGRVLNYTIYFLIF
jgi:hypothetical protein